MILSKEEESYEMVINHLILNAKHFIYRCKPNNTRPLADVFIEDLKKQHLIDKERTNIYKKLSLSDLWKSPIMALVLPNLFYFFHHYISL